MSVAGGRDGDEVEWTGATLSWRRLRSGAVTAQALDAETVADFWDLGTIPSSGGALTVDWEFSLDEPYALTIELPYRQGGAARSASYTFRCE